MSDEKTLNIANIARGALVEISDVEITNALNNIIDKNTDFKKARKVTLTIEFRATDESRETVMVDLHAKSALAPYKPVSTQLYVGKENGVLKAQEFNRGTIPGQTEIVDNETGEIVTDTARRKILNIKR